MKALSPTLAALLKKTKSKYAGNAGRSVKLKEGSTRVRILQQDPDNQFWADLGVHWIKTEKNGKPVAVVGCHDVVKDEPCPICTAIEKAAASVVDDDTLEIIKEWRARKSVLVNALIRSGSEASEDPVVLELTTTTFGHILSVIEQYAMDDINVLDPKEGVDFVIERKGKGLNTEYTVMPAPKSKPVDPAVLERLTDLSDYIEKQFFRGEESKALRAIGQVTGVSTSPALTASKAPALTGPFTDPVDEDEDAPFEPDEKPAAKVAKPAAKPAAAPKKAKEPEPEAEDEFDAPVSAEDLDSMLEGLGGLGELEDLD